MHGAETTKLRDFVRKHCAITARPDGRSEVEPGYFRFDVGPSSRRARKKGLAANVDYGEPDSTFEAVSARLRMLFKDGHPKVFVRAIGHADSSPVDSLDFENDTMDREDDHEDDEDGPKKGRHALVEGHAHVVMTLARQLERVTERVVGMSEDNRELYMRARVFELVAQGNADAGTSAMVATLATALGPGASQAIPMLVAGILRSYGLDPSPPSAPVAEPEDPAARLDHYTAAMEALFGRMAATCAAHPELVTPERIARWSELIGRAFGGGRPDAPPPPADADIVDANPSV